jgi:hypothetical protein
MNQSDDKDKLDEAFDRVFWKTWDEVREEMMPGLADDIMELDRALNTTIEEKIKAVSLPRTRPVDSWAAQYELLYALLPVLEAAKIIEPTAKGYDWKRKQYLFLWLLHIVDPSFNDWKGAAFFFTIQGKETTSVRLRNAYQKLGENESPEWFEIEALIQETAKSLPKCK